MCYRDLTKVLILVLSSAGMKKIYNHRPPSVSTPFAPVPSWAFTHKEGHPQPLSPLALAVWFYLHLAIPSTHIAADRVAAANPQWRVGEKSIWKALRELHENGWIRSRKVAGGRV
jgi:hypothetical protein